LEGREKAGGVEKSKLVTLHKKGEGKRGPSLRVKEQKAKREEAAFSRGGEGLFRRPIRKRAAVHRPLIPNKKKEKLFSKKKGKGE